MEIILKPKYNKLYYNSAVKMTCCEKKRTSVIFFIFGKIIQDKFRLYVGVCVLFCFCFCLLWVLPNLTVTIGSNLNSKKIRVGVELSNLHRVKWMKKEVSHRSDSKS